MKYTCIKCEEEKEAAFIGDGYKSEDHTNAKICNACFDEVIEEVWSEMRWYEKVWYILTSPL